MNEFFTTSLYKGSEKLSERAKFCADLRALCMQRAAVGTDTQLHDLELHLQYLKNENEFIKMWAPPIE